MTVSESITEKSQILLAKRHDILGHEIPPPPPAAPTPEQVAAGVAEAEARAVAAEAKATRAVADAEAARRPVPPSEADHLRAEIDAATEAGDLRRAGRLKLRLAHLNS